MKYLMLICGDPDHTAEDAAEAPPIEDWFDYANSTGAYELGVRLQPTEQATTVRVRGGKLLVTDGPFAETKEWIAGVAIIEAATLDAAIELARRNESAWHGRIELRPIHSMGGPGD